MTRVRTSLLTLLVALSWAVPTQAQAQTGTVAGRIFDDATLRPIEGVTLTVLGTGRTGLSNADGRFVITAVPVGIHTLTAEVLGYADATREITVSEGETVVIDIQMISQALQMQEIVVTGYGQQVERDVTGVINSVGAEEFNQGVITAPEELIQGKVAGVQVITPGFRGGVNIRIRGGTSINASNEPLFVIDGQPVAPGGGLGAGSNPLNFLNPDDILSVTVLKDASAAAIYGSRGANGVILIETKEGREGSFIQYTGSVNMSNGVGELDMVRAADFRAAVAEYAPQSSGLLLNADTDWRDEIMRSAYGQEHNLTVDGGSETSNYRASMGYYGRDGIVRGSDTERLTASLNFSQLLFENSLSVEANIRGARILDNFSGSSIGNATGFAPTQPVMLDGQYYEWDAAAGLSPENPFPEIENIVDEGTAYRSLGTLEVEWDIPGVRGLTATSHVGYDIAKTENVYFAPSFLKAQAGGSNPGTLSRSNNEQLNTLFDGYLTYTRPFGENHDLSLTGGYSYENSRSEFPSFFASGLSADFLGPNGIPDANEVGASLFVEESRLISFFGRVNYSYADKYLFTGSLRRDGSSRFGPDEQWGIFPSAAFAWRIAGEDFMSDSDLFSELKLRVSWGVTGNQEFANYQQYSSYLISDPFARVQFGDRFVPTIRPSAADPGIKWEETTSWNAGLDYGLWNDRVTGAVDVYFKKTEDLIFTVPVAAGTNLSDFVTTNVGSVENKGIEFSLAAAIVEPRDDRAFSWDAGITFAYNKNELTQINAVGAGDEQILVGGIAGGVGNTIQVLQPGHPVNSFHTYEHIRDASGNPIYEDVNGDGLINEQDLYVDRNGDGTVNQDDRFPNEQPAAPINIGHSSRFSFGGFDLSYGMRVQLGNHVYNNIASDGGNYNRLNGPIPYSLHGTVLEYGFQDPQYFSDIYVEDASFLRLDNITLGYTVDGLGVLDGARIFGTVQNVFTITGYSGLDPEALIGGIDNNLYPRARTFSVGLTLGF
ncbi:MAG TPA: SusC/RagA family TonB-linked outer membrane protein [Longimicrobiales bacterium]|nr:SusC/RagA family TonB-linked outer membrane protein [Longimicrobiales bacterium]